MVAVYYGDGADEENRLFSEAVIRDPENWVAHMHRLTGLSEKYNGSHDSMFEFAYESAAKAAPGSLLPVLLTKAHSEYWKYQYKFDQNEEEAARYLHSPHPREVTIEAYNQSLANFGYEPRHAVFARINAAGWFWLVKEREPLRRELELLNGSICDDHWKWVGTWGDLDKAKEFSGAA